MLVKMRIALNVLVKINNLLKLKWNESAVI